MRQKAPDCALVKVCRLSYQWNRCVVRFDLSVEGLILWRVGEGDDTCDEDVGKGGVNVDHGEQLGQL